MTILKSRKEKISATCWDNFSHTQDWIFDLDNTLYPAHYDVFTQVDKRIGSFVSHELGLADAEVSELRKGYIASHGSTFRAMVDIHNIDVDAFLHYVHDINVDHLPRSETLGESLKKLPGRKFVFTSATLSHANRVMGRLGISGHFQDIFDIKAANYIPKPSPDTYQLFAEKYQIEPTCAVMVEDIARNLMPAAALGMTTVWVPNSTSYSLAESDGEHIHHIIDDVANWLMILTDNPACRGS